MFDKNGQLKEKDATIQNIETALELMEEMEKNSITEGAKKVRRVLFL